MQDSVDLSMVVPAYNESANIEAFFEAVLKAFDGFDGTWQLVLVDDGSSDGTYEHMRRIAELPDLPCTVTAVALSRNFGKEAALYAGLEHAYGECVGFIDADLQQRPETFLAMYRMLVADDSYDCVAAYQEQRTGGALRNWFSKRFYRVLEKSAHMDVVADASDFRVFRRPVADALLRMGEYHRFSKGLFAWVGFRTLPYPYTPESRHAGESSWSFAKLVRYALGGLMSFSTFPLTVATYLGGISAVAAIAYLVEVVAKRLVFGVEIPGYATIVVLLLLFGGLQLLVLGVMGNYLARVYIQGKQRPIYLARTVVESPSTAWRNPSCGEGACGSGISAACGHDRAGAVADGS